MVDQLTPAMARWAPRLASTSIRRINTAVGTAATPLEATNSDDEAATTSPRSTQPVARLDWQRSDIFCVLVNPQIPQNTGNIARTCAATNIALHLVGPMGFKIDDKKMKRAGLDYWDFVTCAVHENWDEFYSFFKSLPGENRLIGYSKLSKKHHATEGMYRPGTWLMFGAETTGLPPEAFAAALESGGEMVKIPMANYKHVRSLNLSTSVGVGLFEALRQLDGPTLPEDIDDGELSAEAVNLEAALRE